MTSLFIPTEAQISNRLAAESRCPNCGGTGKRGCGKCRECGGGGVAHLTHPRVRFNWGFHDAASDARHGSPRELRQVGAQNETAVSAEFNFWYAHGYEAGLRAVESGTSTDLSDAAWIAFTGEVAR